MEYWDESQGQPPLYAKFGTVPGRNYVHVYHDKHQATGFQTYQPERPDRSREPNCWTIPGSRAAGVLQDYTNWTDPDLSPSASYFPFTLDNQTRQLQGLKEYQAHEKREREWVAEKAQRAVWDRDRERECERRTQKESWQRRWESCSPVHYRREIAKRSLSDSSYRELEAWAARYSHSLPRRRRMEAELLGTAQGSPESERVLERGSRSATEPRSNEINLPRLSRQTRELGHLERRDAQQSVNHRFSQSIVPETTYISDTKENEIKHPRKMFSAPPGYMPPPPYDTPHNISPVLPHPEKYNTEEIVAFGSPSWESRTHSPAYCSQTILKKQASVDSPNEKGGQEELTGPAWLSHQGPAAADLSWLNSPPQNTVPKELNPCNSSLEQELAQPPQRTYGPTDGRRLSLKKRRRGGETIFCLVSRMEGMEETSSFTKEPLSLPLLNPSPLVGIPSTELTEFSRNPGEFSDKNELQKLADEVDSGTSSLQLDAEVPAHRSSLKKESNLKLKNSDWMNSKQVAAHREELLRVIKNRTKTYESNRKSQSLSDQADKDTDLKENKHLQSSSSPMSERRSVQPLASASVKYPLWREPNNVVRLESDSYPCCSKESWKGNEPGIDLSNDQRQKSDVGNPIDFEVKKLEIKKDKDSENSSGILVIDTTHVIVRVEFIFPPKKEYVQYLPQSSPPPGLDCVLASETIQPDTQIKEETSELITNKPCHVPDNEKAKRESEEVDVQEYVYQDQHSHFRVLVIETGVQKKSGETGHISNTTERNAAKNDTEKTSGFAQQDSDIQSQNETTSVLKSYIEDQTKEGVSLHDDCKGNDANECISEAIIREELSKVASTEFDQAEDVVCVTDVIQKDTIDLGDQISTENKEVGMEQRERIYDTEMENYINIDPKVQEMTLQETVVTSEPSIESSHITSHEAQSQLDLETVPVLHLNSPPHSPEDSPCQSPPLSPKSQSHCPLDSIDPLSFPNQPLLSLVDSSSDPNTLCADFSETTTSTHFRSALPIPSEPVSPSSSSFSHDICSNLQCPNILFPSTSGEEAQYPKSLWDAVNRIRKHTAPDSENEEEEVVEPWDPESMGEDSGCLETGIHLMKEKTVVPDGPKELVVFSSVGKITMEPGSSEVHSGDGVDFQKIKQHGKCTEGLFGPIIYDILDESLDNTPDESLDNTPDESLDNILDESLDNTPDESLDNTLDESLDNTPDESLDNTLDESLDNTPDESLDNTPDESLDNTLDESLDNTPDESLDNTPDESLDNTLDESLENTPDESLENTPDESLDNTPDVSLIDTLDEYLDETFDQSLDDTLSSSSTESHGSGDTVIIGEEEDAEKNSETEKETEKEAEINKEGDIIHQDLSFTEVDGRSSLVMSTGKTNVKGEGNETSKMEKPPNERRETEERQESGEVKYHAEEDKTHTDQPTSEGDSDSVKDLDLET